MDVCPYVHKHNCVVLERKELYISLKTSSNKGLSINSHLFCETVLEKWMIAH